MNAITPSQASKKLEIQPSTLRKYSLLLQENGVQFERNANDSRIYTNEDVVTLQKMITLIKTDGVSVKDAAFAASRLHIGESDGVTSNVTDNAMERHNDDMTLALVAEIKGLKDKIDEQQQTIEGFRQSQEQRDAYFVEILEDLNGQIKQLNEQQALPEPEPEPQNIVPVEEPKKGFFSRIFGK